MMVQPPDTARKEDDRECPECNKPINNHSPEQAYICNRMRLERKQFTGDEY